MWQYLIIWLERQQLLKSVVHLKRMVNGIFLTYAQRHKWGKLMLSWWMAWWPNLRIKEYREQISIWSFTFSTLGVHRFRIEFESRGLTKDYEYGVRIRNPSSMSLGSVYEYITGKRLMELRIHLWTLKLRRLLWKAQDLYHLSILLDQSVPLRKCFSVESRERLWKSRNQRVKSTSHGWVEGR